MTYTTRNNVGIEWEGGLQSVKTHLFIETSKFSLFSGHMITPALKVVQQDHFVTKSDLFVCAPPGPPEVAVRHGGRLFMSLAMS